MEPIQQLLSDNLALTPDEKQLVIYLAWLLRPVDEHEKTRVWRHLNARLSHSGLLDHDGLMNELGDVIAEFEPIEA